MKRFTLYRAKYTLFLYVFFIFQNFCIQFHGIKIEQPGTKDTCGEFCGRGARSTHRTLRLVVYSSRLLARDTMYGLTIEYPATRHFMNGLAPL